jgi:hypothetical protein
LLCDLRAQTITQGVRSLEEDIKGEEDKIRAEQNISAACEIKLLPWETVDEQKSILTADLQEKILGLSAEPMTFIEPPPSDCGFQFALTPHITCATNMLQLDQQLAKVLSAVIYYLMCVLGCASVAEVLLLSVALCKRCMQAHSRLIVKMPEAMFWKNYFYKVSLLRAAAGVEPLTALTTAHIVASTTPKAIVAARHNLSDEEYGKLTLFDTVLGLLHCISFSKLVVVSRLHHLQHYCSSILPKQE